MEHLWAPWRMTYIKKNKKEENCFFCDGWQQGVSKETGVLFRGKSAFVIINRFPYNSGHLMVVPALHAPSVNDLSEEEYLALFRLARLAQSTLDRAFTPSGYNWGLNLGKAAGAGIVDHLHLHILPRWEGDTNFMPLLAETKVLPEHLEQTYETLLSHFQQLPKERI